MIRNKHSKQMKQNHAYNIRDKLTQKYYLRELKSLRNFEQRPE